MERFYNKRHCSTYRERAEIKIKSTFNDEEITNDEEISNSLR